MNMSVFCSRLRSASRCCRSRPSGQLVGALGDQEDRCDQGVTVHDALAPKSDADCGFRGDDAGGLVGARARGRRGRSPPRPAEASARSPRLGRDQSRPSVKSMVQAKVAAAAGKLGKSLRPIRRAGAGQDPHQTLECRLSPGTGRRRLLRDQADRLLDRAGRGVSALLSSTSG